ncbi:AAA family ATPase [Sutcliffiella cohnii]|uniref:AAA family ATPase n=1 Tax=Sutcliffiella cohnii TaxID=33932 RepID=UPI002E1B5E07|nr:AAA family ATPase [Sutcliffiella cohnii]MED4019158.1 AAA family ATPase [Sutcliffiella cohnii]
MESYESILLKDNYLNIAYKRYLAYKETEQYNDENKLEVLTNLNEYLREKEINQDTVVYIVKRLQKDNTPSEIFVNEDKTADLVEFAENRPEEVASLLKELYQFGGSIGETIDQFIRKGKDFKSSISFDASLFGYLLAAKEYALYPLYDEAVFSFIKNTYGLASKSGTVGSEYLTYLNVCTFVLKHFQKTQSDLTMLDVQDFFLCHSQSNKIIVETSVEYLHTVAVKLASYMKNPADMLRDIVDLDTENLLSLREQYRNEEKVKLIRYRILDNIISSKRMTIEELEQIKDEVKVKYETNILQSWNNFTILFQLYYADKKQKVREEQRKIHQAICEIEELKELSLWKDKVLNGFNGNQYFGSTRCWLAVYEEKYDTHRIAPQIFVAVNEQGVQYGLDYGDQHDKKEKKKYVLESNIDAFSYEDFYYQIINVLDAFKESGGEQQARAFGALSTIGGAQAEQTNKPYSKEDFFSEVFMEEKQYSTMVNLLRYKKNLILQGPPGVGKTYVSKRLAYSLMREKDDTRVEMVQFHQNYSYEDFVMGYRPKENGFTLKYGIFYEFCKKAIENEEKDYYFIIDEINRGNLSKIFGELLMLIEQDKRDDFVSMSYNGEKFTVPSNVYIIGTMNTADRSLAQLEVALRRRFAFVTLTPNFNAKWREFLKGSGVSTHMLDRIQYAVDKWNTVIVNDYQLGQGYAIGHSFFTKKPDYLTEEIWFENIIQFEITPLLEEYFYDRPEVVKELIEGM